METPHVPPSKQLRFSVVVPTRWVDGDVQGVLNNAVFSTLLEEARYAYFDRMGLIEEGRFPFLLAHLNIAFLAPAHGGRRALVEMGTTKLGTKPFEQVYRVREANAKGEAEGSMVWAEARARLVCYDPESGKSRAMGTRFRVTVEAFEGMSAG